MKEQEISPCCLTIAGSDSGGNAGVQADLRAFHAYGVHGCTVFSAMTAQNPFGVSAIHPLPVDFVSAQLDAVLGVYEIKAMKTGMIAKREIIEMVAEKLKRHPEIFKVIDPVMIATSGAKLIADDAIAALAEKLLPLANLITPNLPEAKTLAGRDLDMRELARVLFDRFGCAILVKGGHSDDKNALDIMFDGESFFEFSMNRIEAPISTHGTGCSLSAAIAAGIARGATIVDAITQAKHYVHDAIANSYYVGKNCGVLGFAPRKVD